MLFNIKFKSVQVISKYPINSALVIFCSNNSEFEKILKNKNTSVSKPQKVQFNEIDNAEIHLWNVENPNLVVVKKTDINKKFNVDFFRNYLTGFLNTIEKLGIKNIFIEIPDYNLFNKIFTCKEQYWQSFAEGVLLGNYSFDNYKTKKRKIINLNINFVTEEINSFQASFKKAESIISGVYFSRDLTNEPSNTLTPLEFSKRVKKELTNINVSVKVFNENELQKRKMNAILNVGKASINRPQMIIAHYKPKVKVRKKIVLVGKGVTYDTGGLSIKPTNGMLEMKADMAGGAVVFGIIKAAALNKIPVEIFGVVPAVENAINGNAYKPGDIISTASGKTIEVKDTDAEGRIILADALEYASKLKPDEIIDFATLTGAVAVSLGLFTAGLFTKNDEISNAILRAGESTYEHIWRMPFWDEYNSLLESKIADISNLGPRWGGAITAGKFLEFFVDEKIPWAHIDLAGPSLKHDFTNYTKDFCTGYGVRLIYEYLDNL
jgi:leucyl aminopeptidase